MGLTVKATCKLILKLKEIEARVSEIGIFIDVFERHLDEINPSLFEKMREERGEEREKIKDPFDPANYAVLENLLMEK
jgi:hypothetical protein